MFFYVFMSSLNHKLINLSKQQLQKSTSKGNKGPWSFMSIHKRNSIFYCAQKVERGDGLFNFVLQRIFKKNREFTCKSFVSSMLNITYNDP